MCVGCRERGDKARLVRLVWRDGVVVDEAQTAPGRGAYLHRRGDCLSAALKRRAVGRALRVPGADSGVTKETIGAYLAPEQEITSRNPGSVA